MPVTVRLSLQMFCPPFSTQPGCPGGWPLGTALREFSVFCPLVGFRFRESAAGDGGEEVKEGRILISLLSPPPPPPGRWLLCPSNRRSWMAPSEGRSYMATASALAAALSLAIHTHPPEVPLEGVKAPCRSSSTPRGGRVCSLISP